MSGIVVCLLGAALLVWGIALLRELRDLFDHHDCDRRLRLAGLGWLKARHWRLAHACLLVTALALPWSAARGSWPAILAALMLPVVWALPPLWLRWRIRSRRSALRRALPGTLARLCCATQCQAPFEEALQLTLRWGPGGPLCRILQQQLLDTAKGRAARWPRPRLHYPLTPLAAELLDAAHDAKAHLSDHEEQLRRWQWLLIRSHPAARHAYDPQRRQSGVPAPDAARDIEVTSE